MASSKGIVTVLLVVDSRLRDKQKYPNPNSYVIDLGSSLNDVVKMSLTNATLPGNALYSLPASRCYFSLKNGVDGLLQKVMMLEGDYVTIQDVSSTLQSVLTAAGLADVSVSVNPVNGCLVVSSSSPFSLCFAENGPSHFLGFGISTYESTNVGSSVWSIVAPFKVDLEAYKRYVTIEMLHPGGGSQPVMIAGPSQTTDAVAVYIFNRDHSISKCERMWDPPLFSFSRIGISLKDEYGGLIDFQNQDHVLEFTVDMRINTNRFF